METELIIAMLAGVFGLVVLGMCFVQMGKAIWSCFNHTSWEKEAIPDPNAIVTGVNSRQVKYVKNGAKFKTTVTFSDGFTFVTHKTNRENHFGSYTISVNRMEIAEMAKAAHAEAVSKMGIKAAPTPVPAPVPETNPDILEVYPNFKLGGSSSGSSTQPMQPIDTGVNKPVIRPIPADDAVRTDASPFRPISVNDGYPETAPVTRPIATSAVEKAIPAGDGYPVTAPVTKPIATSAVEKAVPAGDGYPVTAPVTKPIATSAVEKAVPAGDGYPVTAPVTKPIGTSAVEKAIPAGDGYPVTAPVTKSKPAVIISTVEKAIPAGDGYPVTAPVTKSKPAVIISTVEKAIPSGDGYPVTAPVTKPGPAAGTAQETTRWICPKCGLVHNKALAVCFHCGTQQSKANKFV